MLDAHLFYDEQLALLTSTWWKIDPGAPGLVPLAADVLTWDG